MKIAFNNVDGIISVEPSHKTKTMKVVFDESKITVEEIKQIIKNTGREVKDE
ncbi:MAG: cation transporter [Elusimicrobiota bacterium]